VLDADGRVSIAKFPSGDTDAWSVPAWEMVALDLAARAGVTVPRSRLLRVGGRAVLILARFDRVGDRRIGYASAMTMLEARERDQRSYLDIAGVIEQRSDRATDELHQLWRRVAFTVLISNTDDHLRNHGFVHVDRSVWRLSPAFDLNPTPGPARARLRTTIDGSTDAASIDLLLSVAPSFRLDQAEAIAALGQVSAATRGWRHVAGDHGLPAREVDLMTPAFEHDEAETARRITR